MLLLKIVLGIDWKYTVDIFFYEQYLSIYQKIWEKIIFGTNGAKKLEVKE